MSDLVEDCKLHTLFSDVLFHDVGRPGCNKRFRYIAHHCPSLASLLVQIVGSVYETINNWFLFGAFLA